jgi:hypothetical protein
MESRAASPIRRDQTGEAENNASWQNCPSHVTCNVMIEDQRMPTHVNQRVQKRRETLRAAGLRPIQIWVPDTRRPGFAEECRRQSRLVAASDAADPDLDAFMEAARLDLPPEREA